MKIKPQYVSKCAISWTVDLGSACITVYRDKLTNDVTFEVVAFDPNTDEISNATFGNSHIKVFTMMFYRKNIEMIGFNTLAE